MLPSNPLVRFIDAFLRFAFGLWPLEVYILIPIVTEVLATAGRTVVTSGATMAFASLALMMVNYDVVRAFAIVLAVAPIVSVGASMTLLPALLLTFPDFFIPEPGAPNERTHLAGTGKGYPLLEGHIVDKEFTSSRWYRLGQVITRPESHVKTHLARTGPLHASYSPPTIACRPPWNWLAVWALASEPSPSFFSSSSRSSSF